MHIVIIHYKRNIVFQTFKNNFALSKKCPTICSCYSMVYTNVNCSIGAAWHLFKIMWGVMVISLKLSKNIKNLLLFVPIWLNKNLSVLFFGDLFCYTRHLSITLSCCLHHLWVLHAPILHNLSKALFCYFASFILVYALIALGRTYLQLSFTVLYQLTWSIQRIALTTQSKYISFVQVQKFIEKIPSSKMFAIRKSEN